MYIFTRFVCDFHIKCHILRGCPKLVTTMLEDPQTCIFIILM